MLRAWVRTFLFIVPMSPRLSSQHTPICRCICLSRRWSIIAAAPPRSQKNKFGSGTDKKLDNERIYKDLKPILLRLIFPNNFNLITKCPQSSCETSTAYELNFMTRGQMGRKATRL